MEGKSQLGGKKRRRIRSCNNCRKRKVQCDQANNPACGRCVETGQAANCQYLDDFAGASVQAAQPTERDVSEPVHHSSPPASESPARLLSRLQEQERRIANLEATLASAKTDLAQTSRGSERKVEAAALPIDDDSGGEHGERIDDPADHETILLKGGSFKTRFFGDTHPESLISNIPSFGTLSKEIVASHPILVKLRQDLRATANTANNSNLGQSTIADADLKAMMPARAETDELVRLYFDTYDWIYHVIHTPSFWKEYDEMWSDLEHARPSLVALVLAVMAVSCCLRPRETWTYAAKGSAARLKAVSMIQVCEDWHRVRSGKNATVADFQLRFLLNLARLVNGAKSKRSWTDAGAAVRHCMAAGMHKSPKWLVKPTSELDKEMRRRLWYATVEFELQASFQRGLPSQQWLEYGDCEVPRNISDSDISPSSQEPPVSVPTNNFTRASYLSTVETTFELRSSLNSTLNKDYQSLSFSEVRRLTEQITKRLKEIPQWTNDWTVAPQALLALNLRQHLLVLHFRQLRKASPSFEREFSKTIIMDTAVSIVETHKGLVNRGCYTLQLLCQDQMRSALTVCYAVDASETSQFSPSSAMFEQSAQYVADEVVETFRSKVDRLGAGQQQLWTALVARTLIQTKIHPTAKPQHISEAVQVMAALYYKMLACQVPQIDATTTAGDQSLPLWSTDDALHRVEQQRSNGLELEGWPTPDLADLADWTFDEWTFASSALDT